MLTFSRLEHKGNLGNQLFQIAAVIGIANNNGHNYAFPEWRYSNYFKNQLPILSRGDSGEFLLIREQDSTFYNYLLDHKNYDFDGWFQSEKYFNIKLAKYHFTFKEELVERIKWKFREALSRETILISIRRGDFVDHPDFYQLPINYYITALNTYFPNWQNCSVIAFSDDFEYLNFHFGCLTNIYFSKELTPIEQLTLSTQCDNFIISNSTFSWWCAWLGEKPDSIVIRPNHFFSEVKRRANDDRDYFPERWIVHNHENLKITLTDVLFKIGNEQNYLKEYYESYFDCQKTNKSLGKEVNILNGILPPLPLLLAIKRDHNVLVYSKRVIFISPNRETSLFLKQKDFGLFSTIFRTRGRKKYLVAQINSGNTFMTVDVFLNYSGKISSLRGNKYLYDRWKRKMIHNLKIFIKRRILKNLKH